MRLILSLCDFTGNWSRPYEEVGYSVVRIDLKHGHDVRLMEYITAPVHGILAAPPCTVFAGSGARWWEEKGEQALVDGLALVDACLRAVALYRPLWWALENPVGRLNRWLGPPAYTFNPNEFGDPYTKKTHLWGRFNYPRKTPVAATEGSRMHKLPPSEDRQALRSETPMGFARAFFEANP
jgi:hypothetical protein